MLAREEYVEQAYFFRRLAEQLGQNSPAQDVLAIVREEILATTKLPLAIDFMLSELRHAGAFASAMRKLEHYFTPFQSFVIGAAEDEHGRFDLRVALEVLRREAEYRSDDPSPQGVFLYQFESLCRNRLGYDQGLDAVALDPTFDDRWRRWIGDVRRQVRLIDIADLIYVASDYYGLVQRQRGGQPTDAPVTGEGAPIVSDADPATDTTAAAAEPLFGEREGRIALANRRKDPMVLFASLHRQLGYPEVPRPKFADQSEELLPMLARRMERLETRLKLWEEEHRGGIDLSQFYEPPD